MARKSSKKKQSSLSDHLAHPLPGVRIVRGKDAKRQVVLGRPGLLSTSLTSQDHPRSTTSLCESAEASVPEASAPVVVEVDTDAAIDQLWLAGLKAFESGDRDKAAECWNKTLALDPSCADAMLGLHALDPSRDDLLRAMLAVLPKFGELRERNSRRLTSSYRPAGFMIEELDIDDDLRRALAIYEHRCGDDAAANLLLEESRPCTLTSAVWARIAFENADYARCLSICQKLQRDADIAADIDLMTGCSLVALELPSPAIEILQRAALNAAEVEAELHARYYLMLAFEAEGLNDDVQEQLELIYSNDINFADVANRLGIAPCDDRAPAASGALDPTWQSLVGRLTVGPLATDPSILDNAVSDQR